MVYLCRKFGLDEVAEYWHQVVKINDYQKNRFAQKIIDHFGGDLTEKRVTILGWSFKANTNDSRESAAIFVTERLYKAGATLEIYDPMVPKNIILDDIKAYWTNIDELKFLKSRLIFLEVPKQKFKKRDIVAILTEWEEFKSYDYSQATLFDGRNLIK